jgi:tetratricopeptide (TPR) repeat protein
MPTDAPELATAQACLARGDLAGAEVYFRQVERESEAWADARAGLATVLLATGRPREAEGIAREALEASDAPEAQLLLGQALLGLGRLPEALTALTKALGGLPGDERPALLVGHVQARLGRQREAIKAYEAAARLAPRHAAARFYLAEALIRGGDLLNASSHLNAALQLAPGYQPGHMLKADMAVKIRDHKQAITSYVRAEDLAPLPAPAVVRLGDAYRATGEVDLALFAYEVAIERDKACWAAYEAAGRLCETPRDWPLARRFYKALGASPAHAAAAKEGLARASAVAATAGADAVAMAAPRVRPARFTAPPAPLPRATTPIIPGRGATGHLGGPQRGTRPLALPSNPDAMPWEQEVEKPASPAADALPWDAPAVPAPGALPWEEPPPPAPPQPPQAPAAQAGTRPLALPPSQPANTKRSSFQLGGTAPLKPRPPDQKD